MIIDIYSRKIIAAEVFASESGKHAAELLQRAVWNEKCSSSNLVLHSDNGSPHAQLYVVDKIYALGVLSSYSRPRVSNDILSQNLCSGLSNIVPSGLRTVFSLLMIPKYG
ncbi:integrase, catalytic region [Escherichia coli T426]|nr:integrase, catalytic region [Escherichia coli T426]